MPLMPATDHAALDTCFNCRYWDAADEHLDPDERADGLGVCRIQSYPDDYSNHSAYVTIDQQADDDGPAVLVTNPDFFCNLYKVGG